MPEEPVEPGSIEGGEGEAGDGAYSAPLAPYDVFVPHVEHFTLAAKPPETFTVGGD